MKRQWILAIFMAFSGWCVFAASGFYVPQQPAAIIEEPETTEELVSSEPEYTVTESTKELQPDQTESEKVYEPAPDELNLAHYFPEEEADTDDIIKSYAGMIFAELMNQDQNWIEKIYDYADISPQKLASRIGRPKSAVLGKYNPKNDLHDPNDPNTWFIDSFRDIRISVLDGDHNPVNLDSNVIEIMSMANVYTYYKGVGDHDLFLSYARTLWDKSHSYSISISDLYYCDGCLTEEEEKKQLEKEAEREALNTERILRGDGETTEEEASAAKDKQTGAESRPHPVPSDTSIKNDENTGTVLEESGAVPKETGNPVAGETENKEPEEIYTSEPSSSKSAVIFAGKRKKAEEEETGTEPESATEQTAQKKDSLSKATPSNMAEPEIQEKIIEENNSGNNSDLPETISMETFSSETTSPETVETVSSESSETTSSKTISPEMDPPKSVSPKTASCPGHVDLIVKIHIRGIEEENGLFKADPYGNDTASFEEGGWQGWNQEAMDAVKRLSSQDWYDKYKMNVSVIAVGNPLTNSEIQEYMGRLPDDISKTRRDIIRFALSSVGKVPYYWGGKPSAPNYSRNGFGTFVSPDYKGRVLKGLDCSGWISWVYWSVTGKRLAYESTSGLALCGSPVSRSNLQPGDIILRTGENAHVIMFLEWTEDGKIRCIHESSVGINNVTVAVREANWPYYRKLTD